MNSVRQIEVLDLRHFNAGQLRALLEDEARRWQQRLHWDYKGASELLLEYIDGRVLPGFVARLDGRIVGYAFCVLEASKGVIGDVYAFGETEAQRNPVCELLLVHLLELVQAMPGVQRVESQLLMFPAGALHGPFLGSGFRGVPRLFMSCELRGSRLAEGPQVVEAAMDGSWRPERWRPEFYDGAAALIHRAYLGHMDSDINDQYRSVAGAQRFLHNIIRFPGCGSFDAENSCVLRGTNGTDVVAVLLCSRVRGDVGHITQLCVGPELRGKGLGHLLLRHCASRLPKQGVRSLSLTVTEANAGALRLYAELGFKVMHRFEAMVWDTAWR